MGASWLLFWFVLIESEKNPNFLREVEEVEHKKKIIKLQDCKTSSLHRWNFAACEGNLNQDLYGLGKDNWFHAKRCSSRTMCYSEPERFTLIGCSVI